MLLNVIASDAMLSVLFIILSYLIGSIPFGIVLGKGICHIDIREHGSKNIGSTNAIRVLGKKVGFLVFFCDVFKGMAVIILLKILATAGIWQTPIEYFFYGAAAIIGHCFSIFLDFKGGKAVGEPRRHSAGICLQDGELHLRLRPLPGRLPVEQVCAGHN